MYKILVPISLLLCFCNVPPIEDRKSATRTVITCEVEGFDIGANIDQVDLIYNNTIFYEQKVDIEYLDQNGKFHFEFDRLYPREIYLKYNNLLFFVFVFPGDSINIIVEAAILDVDREVFNLRTGNPSMIYDYIDIKCKHQQFQDEFIEYRRLFSDTLFSFERENQAMVQLKYDNYKDYIKKRTHRYRTILEGHYSKQSTSTEFREWLDNWIDSKELLDLMYYTWYHPFSNKIDRDTFRLPDSYFDFLLDKDYNKESMATNRDYFDFLHEFSGYLWRYKTDPEDKAKLLAVKKNTGNSVGVDSLVLNTFLENSSGFVEQFLLARYFSIMIDRKSFESFEALYNPDLIGRRDYADILEKAYTKAIQDATNPEYANNLRLNERDPDNGLPVFSSLPDKHVEKVIYVDFWAPWCGPCMKEMLSSKELQEEYKGKDIAFVFLANKCSEESWKATLSEQKLTGDHYLLSDKEYELLSDKFDIQGIPRYMIIDKMGRVVNENAPRPSGNTLSLLLDKLLED